MPQIEQARESLHREFINYQAAIRNGHPIAQGFFEDGQDLDIELASDSAAAMEKFALMRAVLRALVGKSDEMGIPMLFVVIPSPLDLLPNYDVLRVDRRHYPSFNPSALTDELDSVLTNLGAWHVNLEPLFRAHGAEDLFLHVDDAHWSDAGQALGADAVCREILAKSPRTKLPPPRPARLTTSQHAGPGRRQQRPAMDSVHLP
jgi:hypothetical protein